MMIIDENILLRYGATVKEYKKKEFIFKEGEKVKYYYQIKKGAVKVYNSFDDGKEFIQGFPFEGTCFGESYLYVDTPSTINAVAIRPSFILVLNQEGFFKMVADHPHILISLNRYSSERLHFRYLMSSLLVITDPVIKIRMLMDCLKEYMGYRDRFSYLIPLTRTNLAGLTGLRVETVIRAIKKMEAQQLVKITGGKIYYQIALLVQSVFFF